MKAIKTTLKEWNHPYDEYDEWDREHYYLDVEQDDDVSLEQLRKDQMRHDFLNAEYVNRSISFPGYGKVAQSFGGRTYCDPADVYPDTNLNVYNLLDKDPNFRDTVRQSVKNGWKHHGRGKIGAFRSGSEDVAELDESIRRAI